MRENILKIVCAANKYSDGALILGVRHFDDLMRNTMAKINSDINYWKKLKHEQGFIANDYNFYSREESMIIAKNANQQLDMEVANGENEKELFSEHLY